MAAVPVVIPASASSGVKLNRQATANAEDVYTVTIQNPTIKRWFLQLIWSTTPGLYHTTAGQVVANGAQIAVQQPFTIPVGNGTVFYVASTGVGTVDVIAFTDT